MSVILDALHKARSDRKSSRVDGLHGQTVARVVDAAAVEAVAGSMAAAPRPSRRREWLIAFGVIVALIVLFALAAGAFLLIYQQLRQIGSHVGGGPVPAVSDARSATTAALIDAPVVTEALPTPVPVSELPVEPPVGGAAVAAGVDGAGGLAGAAVVGAGNDVALATREDFTLGSIVCENNDCLASLNGRSVRVGDVMRGYEVVAIDSTSVRLKAVNGEHGLVLSLFD